MNNIIKLLLFSSVEGAKQSPPENNLTQTKLSCETLEGAQRDTCSGLSSKDQTEFLSKLKQQIDSLSEGSSKGHIRTVVNIDSYVVNGTECAADTKDIKTKNVTKVIPVTGEGEGEGEVEEEVEGEEESAEEVESDASESSDDEDTKEANKAIRLAKQDAKRAAKEAAEAQAREQAALAKAAETERRAKEKAAREAAEAARQAKLDEEKAKLLAQKEAEEAKRKAAKELAEAQRAAQAEKDAIQKKEMEAKAAAQKEAAAQEAAAKEKEQREIASAIRKAKEEELKAKKEAEEEAAAAKKKAEEEAAAAEAAEAKRKDQEAKEALQKAKEAKAAAQAKNPKHKPNKTKKKQVRKQVRKQVKQNKKAIKVPAAKSDDEEEELKIRKPKKSAIKIKTTEKFNNKTNSTVKAKVSDDDEEDKAVKPKKGTKTASDDEEEEQMKKAEKTVDANVKKAESDEDNEEDESAEKDPVKAKTKLEKVKKELEEDEEESAEKEEIENKKTKKETKAEKKAKAAEEAAEAAEEDAKSKRKLGSGSDEAKKAEALAKELRLKAEAAQLKASKAAAAAKRAHNESATCKIKEAKEAKTEDAAEQALKDAEKARKKADKASDKAKSIKNKKKDEGGDVETDKTKVPDSDKEEESSEDEEEKKRKEAEAAQAKADEEAQAIRNRKEKIRKELAAAEEAARLEAEKQAKELENKIERERIELERKAAEAAEKARIQEEEEKRKAQEEAERLEKQKAIELEEKRKAKIAAEAEARKAEAEAKEKEQRQIRQANEAKKAAAEAKAKKEAEYRTARVAFLDKMPNQVMKGSDKRFQANEQFSIIQYNNQKLNLMRGKYTFRARTYQDAFERFADLVKPIMMRDTDAEFGLVGNKKLLATTSIFNDNLKDKKVKITGDEYKEDDISMMMLGVGLREGIIEWADEMTLEGREYQMISYSKTTKNTTIKLMGSNYGQAKKLFDAEMKKGGYGVLIDWNHNFKYWSADYNIAIQAVSKYFFSKGYYLGVVFDEEKAGFEMEWQVQEKIDAKVKSITGQFSGDGSVFARQQYFYIWKWSGGKVSFVRRGSFWKMGDAYSWYINFTTEYLKRDNGADLLLVGSNTPLLSTASWTSDANKLMVGKAIAEGTISMKSYFKGQSEQYYMLLMNKKTSALKFESVGQNSNKAHGAFTDKTGGGSALYWGILFNSNGKIYKIQGDNSNKMYKGDYWGYWVMTEYIQTSMKMWTTWVHDEKGCGITLKKEEDAIKAEQDAWKREFATRIMKYGGDLIDNFNGTGYRFAKNEKFIGIRYNTVKNEINYWSFYQNNMDRAYETFGKQIKWWATRNYKDTRYNPEEYFLFGNNRMLLSSLSTTNVEADGMNMTNAVVGWAYDKQLYIPDDGLLEPEGYKFHWTLLQDRASNKTTFAKCAGDLAKCSKSFDKETEFFKDEPEKGSRGVLIKGPNDGIKKFSNTEDLFFNSTSWNFKWSLYSLVGEFMANNNDGDFDSYYVPDESSAGFEIKAPYYKNKRLFHSMVNILQANNRYYQVHGWWNTYYLKGPVTYYGDKTKWWKNAYGDINKSDMVQILVADVDKYNSKPVMVYKPGQMLNDTRMFLNFGELTRIKGYAPNNCSFKTGKGENIKMVHRDKKTNEIVFTDVKTTNWEGAKLIARETWKESTGEIWLVYTDQKVYNIYKDDQNPLGELTVLGQWIFESCPDYQHMHPTDIDLGFPTIYEH